MKKYAYYIRSQEGSEVIALVENGSLTVRDHTTNWVSIGSALPYKIRATIIPDPLSKDALDITLPFSRTLNSEGGGHWLAEAVLNTVIAGGYEDPRNLNLQTSMYFYQKATGAMKQLRKTMRRRNQRGGYIHPHEY